MKRKITLTLAMIISLLFLLPSCGKYEEGPGLSLRTKKQRLVGVWTPEKYIDEDGGEQTAGENENTYEFTSNNSFIIRGALGTTNGTWEFVQDKEAVRATYTVPILGEITNQWRILRLTNSELWIIDNNDLRIHLVPA